MAARFHRALKQCLAAWASSQSDSPAHVLEELFLACLSSFERADRRAREANRTLLQLNELIERQVQEIAHELHAEAGQILSSVYLALDDLKREMPPGLLGRLSEIRSRLDRVEEQIRRLSHELRPAMLDDLGLVPALRFLCDGVASRFNIQVELEGSVRTSIAPKVETALYRIVQEALTNAAKHARGSRVVIRLESAQTEVRCSIRDDGVGLDERAATRRRGAGGIGLTGIRARAAAVGGALRIDSAPDRGTELLVTIPLEESHAPESVAG